MSKRSLAIIIVAVLLVVSGVCGYHYVMLSGRQKSTEPTTLRIGTTMPIRTDNMFADYYFGIVTSLSHDRLMRLDAKGRVIPELAENWEVKEEGKVWILHLVKNATWHDGKPLTAEDVAFSINYLLEKVPIYKFHLRLVERAEVVDDYTVKISLKEPWARFTVNLLVVRVIPKHVWEKVDEPLKYHGEDVNIGSGPYVYKSFDEATGTIVFEANQNYRLGKPKVDKVTFKLYKSTEAMIMALKRGDIDTVYHYARGVEPLYVPVLIEDPNIDFMIKPNLGVDNNLWFNTKLYPYNLTEFRQAVSYALNYRDYVNSIMAGYAEVPNAGFVPKGWSYFKETRKLETNLEKACAMLDAVGLRDLNGDGWRDFSNGTTLTIPILVRTDLPEAGRLAELVKRDLESVGLKVDLIPVDPPTFRQRIDINKDFHAFISRTTMWGMMMWAGYGTGYVDARNIGWSLVDDKEFQTIVDEMLKTTSEEEYRNLAHKLQDLYAEKLYLIPLYWGKIIQPYRSDRISGLHYDPMYGILTKETFYAIEVKSKR